MKLSTPQRWQNHIEVENLGWGGHYHGWPTASNTFHQATGIARYCSPRPHDRFVNLLDRWYLPRHPAFEGCAGCSGDQPQEWERPYQSSLFIGLCVRRVPFSVAVARDELGVEVRHWGMVLITSASWCRSLVLAKVVCISAMRRAHAAMPCIASLSSWGMTASSWRLRLNSTARTVNVSSSIPMCILRQTHRFGRPCLRPFHSPSPLMPVLSIRRFSGPVPLR